jgi:hypothetical protein
MTDRDYSSENTRVARDGLTGSLAGRIAAVSAILVAVGGFLDAVVAVTTKASTLTCNLTVSFPWCPIPHTDVVPIPDTDILPPAPPALPQARVSAFVIGALNRDGAPAGGMASARRDWKRATPDRWIEIYPPGNMEYFDVVGRFILADCPGTVAKNENDKKHRFFIPDKGCPGMPFYISDDNKNWGVASAMTDVQ